MARKRAPFIQDYFSGNRKVVHLFPLRSMLEAKAFLLSPAELEVLILLKHTKGKDLFPSGNRSFDGGDKRDRTADLLNAIQEYASFLVK